MLMSATDSLYPAPADWGAYKAGIVTMGEFDMVESSRRPSWSATKATTFQVGHEGDVGGRGERKPRQFSASECPSPARVLSTF